MLSVFITIRNLSGEDGNGGIKVSLYKEGCFCQYVSTESLGDFLFNVLACCFSGEGHVAVSQVSVIHRSIFFVNSTFFKYKISDFYIFR